MKILLYVSLILLVALIISILIIKNQNKKIKIYKNSIKHLEDIIGAKDEIEKKKEQINTDDAVTNFNNSVQFLQNYSKIHNWCFIKNNRSKSL